MAADDGSRRRTVLKGTAIAALASVASAGGVSGQSDDPDGEEAAAMLREFYDGYLEGISHAVATEVQMEASMIEDGTDEPWPLAVWDDVEDARAEGITLGASEGGSQPFWDEYQSFDREFDPDAGDSSVAVDLLETNDPVEAGETLEVTAELTTDGTATADLDLVVGHDPTVEDAATATVDGSETVTLAFETAQVTNTQTFPVRVEGADDAAERTVEVIGTDETA